MLRQPSPRLLYSFSRAEVTELFKQAHRVLKTSGLTVLCAPSTREYGRILVVTAAAVGSAPKRNKIRRQLKALFYEQRFFTHGYDCVFIVRKEALMFSFEQLAQLLAKSLTHAKKLVLKQSEIQSGETINLKNRIGLTKQENLAKKELSSQAILCQDKACVNQSARNSSKNYCARFLIFLIKGIRPLLGSPGCCRYTVTCTDFAVQQLQEQPLHKAIWRISKRVLSCNPFCKPKE